MPTVINQTDIAVYEAEKEVEEGGQPVALEKVKNRLDEKYYGKE